MAVQLRLHGIPFVLNILLFLRRNTQPKYSLFRISRWNIDCRLLTIFKLESITWLLLQCFLTRALYVFPCSTNSFLSLTSRCLYGCFALHIGQVLQATNMVLLQATHGLMFRAFPLISARIGWSYSSWSNENIRLSNLMVQHGAVQPIVCCLKVLKLCCQVNRLIRPISLYLCLHYSFHYFKSPLNGMPNS